MLHHPRPNPIAFSVGPVDVHWYGIMYVLAFALFIILGRVRIRTQRHVQAQGWTYADLDDMLFYGMLGVVIGGIDLGAYVREMRAADDGSIRSRARPRLPSQLLHLRHVGRVRASRG